MENKLVYVPRAFLSDLFVFRIHLTSATTFEKIIFNCEKVCCEYTKVKPRNKRRRLQTLHAQILWQDIVIHRFHQQRRNIQNLFETYKIILKKLPLILTFSNTIAAGEISHYLYFFQEHPEPEREACQLHIVQSANVAQFLDLPNDLVSPCVSVFPYVCDAFEIDGVFGDHGNIRHHAGIPLCRNCVLFDGSLDLCDSFDMMWLST